LVILTPNFGMTHSATVHVENNSGRQSSAKMTSNQAFARIRGKQAVYRYCGAIMCQLGTLDRRASFMKHIRSI
jgi:hypothetical protein